jgi:hypothetical protein
MTTEHVERLVARRRRLARNDDERLPQTGRDIMG